jgi:hypothetical protein
MDDSASFATALNRSNSTSVMDLSQSDEEDDDDCQATVVATRR